ncbi:tRNA 2'-phosphotransferase 1-like isoform X2 [Chenopodium quinoa]|nr:tRNA 2'-phosphotransferase 1-like isoform X2 [Chenopodium quinoa]XP_021756274.1 tRNA 2'-phosphotransferase 1-like isoform X2 [Chenopodium quinoa]
MIKQPPTFNSQAPSPRRLRRPSPYRTLMLRRLPVTIASKAINYPIFLRLLPPRQFSLLTMDGGRESSSFSFSSFARDLPSLAGGREHGDTRGNRGGSRGRGRGRGAPTGTSDRIDTLGRLLVRILRHNATELNLDMRSDGYVKLQDLLKLNMKTRSNIPLSSHSIDEIREAVRIDNKQRLGLLEEDGELWIRANQGHTVKSVESESLLKPILSAEEIPVCVHGTYKRFLQSILASGLKRMSRLHVHFACGLPTDGEVKSGFRRDVNLIIFIDTTKAMEDGMKFYKSENGVILTEGFDGVVPAKYFQKIESWPKRNPVSFQV